MSSTVETKFRLPDYNNEVAVCVLNIAVNQLALIRNDFETPAPECPDHFEPLPKPLAHRFDPRHYHSDGLFLRHTGEPYEQALPRLKFDKLRSDKNYIANMLRCARNSFYQDGASFKVLDEMIFRSKELDKEEHLFIVEYVRNLMLVNRLRDHKRYLDMSLKKQMTVSQEFDVKELFFICQFHEV